MPLEPALEALAGPSGAAALPAVVIERDPLALAIPSGSLGRVAELADAEDSGSCVRKDVGVQVPPLAHLSIRNLCSRQDEGGEE